MKYAVSYTVSCDSSPHTRYYSAIDAKTALEMFKATCEESLVGELPREIKVTRVTKSKNNT